MSQTKSIADQVLDIMAEHLGVAHSTLRRDAVLDEDINADSLDAVEIVLMCEEHFQIEVPSGEIDQLKTVQDVIELVERKVAL